MIRINQNFKIDSLKIRVPLDKFDTESLPKNIRHEVASFTKNPDTNKVDVYITNDGEIEVLNEVPSKVKVYNKVIISNDNGITNMSYQFEESFISYKSRLKVISFKVTAKHLKQRYFEGINRSNIDLIVDYINTAKDTDGNVLKLSKNILLQSYITDIDICKDYNLFDASMDELINRTRTISKTHKEVNKGINVFNAKDNKGIEFGKRETATASYPYLKFYSKTLDAASGLHHRFFEHYNIEVPNNLVRVEYTIKNKKHLDKHGIGNRLVDILNVPNEDLTAICKLITDCHFNKTAAAPAKVYEDSIMFYQSWLLEFVSKEDIESNLKIHFKRTSANRHLEKLNIVNNSKLDNDIDYRKKVEINEIFNDIF